MRRVPSSVGLVAGFVVLLPALLAGCIDDPGETLTGSAEVGDDADLANLTMPDNRSGSFNAFRETNATEEGVGGMAHDHDYWKGRDRVDLFSLRSYMGPRPGAEGASVVFGMPNGSLVYEGTATIEFTVKNPERHVCDPSGFTLNAKDTCTDGTGAGTPALPRVPDPAPPKLRLEYLHSAASTWIPAGDLVWGSALVLPVRPVETDMPHSTRSLWLFRVVSTQPLVDATLTFEAAATIVRGEGVAEWPGHPDFYAKKPWRVVYDGPASTREAGFGGPVFGFNDSLEQKTPGKLVSYGTRTVLAWINITSYQGAPGFEPTYWYLYFHNATGDWYTADVFKKDNTIAVKNLLFTLPVTDDGMDSPYAPDSRWEFVLRGTKELDPLVTGLTCYGGCATYGVDYQMTIIATNQVLPEEAYSSLDDAS
ncbi:MAG TPA: hypothetical protein VI997_10130 [Candidatus Thermoplasmatota archaeon]|nr:hypothetical protein [Candidatus Thermoplasmatota archaeon]